jgi:RNA polymerase sigma-70 factor (ECF subfamily)
LCYTTAIDVAAGRASRYRRERSVETTPDIAHPPLDPLVARALGGDRNAEREICRRLLPAIRAFARRRLDGVAAEDFAQDALVLLVEAMRDGRVHDPARIAGFALGICRNLARERARNGERRRALIAQFGLGEIETVLDNDRDLVGFGRSHLEDCYSQLTEHARRVIRATFCDDDDDAEIAAALAISAGNVRVIRHRSLAALRSCLEKPISWSQSA